VGGRWNKREVRLDLRNKEWLLPTEKPTHAADSPQSVANWRNGSSVVGIESKVQIRTLPSWQAAPRYLPHEDNLTMCTSRGKRNF
jgi:hypothetical protein